MFCASLETEMHCSEELGSVIASVVPASMKKMLLPPGWKTTCPSTANGPSACVKRAAIENPTAAVPPPTAADDDPGVEIPSNQQDALAGLQHRLLHQVEIGLGIDDDAQARGLGIAPYARLDRAVAAFRVRRSVAAQVLPWSPPSSAR